MIWSITWYSTSSSFHKSKLNQSSIRIDLFLNNFMKFITEALSFYIIVLIATIWNHVMWCINWKEGEGSDYPGWPFSMNIIKAFKWLESLHSLHFLREYVYPSVNPAFSLENKQSHDNKNMAWAGMSSLKNVLVPTKGIWYIEFWNLVLRRMHGKSQYSSILADHENFNTGSRYQI